MNEANLTLPGSAGAMWRLVQELDPMQNRVRLWVRLEQHKGTKATDVATALAEVMATMVMDFAQQMGDLQGAISGDKGVLAEMQRCLQEKVERIATGVKIAQNGA